jgi:hypothetical protein
VVEYNLQSSSVFSDGDMAAVTTITIPLGDARHGDRLNGTKGPPAMYPNTNLSWDLQFSAYVWNNKTDTTEMVPYALSLTLQNIPIYQMYNTGCVWYAAGNSLRITGKVALDEMSFTMLRIMQAVMWTLAVAAFASTAWWMLHFAPCSERSEVKYDLLAFSGSLLFALPAVRQLWPGAPPGGTAADGLHIYAQLLLISFAILLQLGKFLYEECCRRPHSSASVTNPAVLPQPADSTTPSTAACTNKYGLSAAQTYSAANSTNSSPVELTVGSWPLGQQCADVVAERDVVQRSTWSACM